MNNDSIWNTDSANDPISRQLIFQDVDPIRVRPCKLGPMAYLIHDHYIGKSLDLYGEFSPGEADFFSQVLKPGMTALDVGANVGAHSVLFSKLVGRNGLVLSFEPQRVIYQLLCTNLMLNGHIHAKAYHAAAGGTPGTLRVPPVDYLKPANFGSLSLGAWEVGEEVPVMTIDQFCLPKCHLIKADVEGMESDVLAGAAETIARCKPILYVENDRKEKSKQLVQTIFDMNYRAFWHITPYFKPNNFRGNSENIFGGTVSINLIGIHSSFNIVMEGAREVLSPDDTWR